MFNLPDTVPWWAVLIIAGLASFIFFVRVVWPQNSNHRKELLLEWFRRDRKVGKRK